MLLLLAATLATFTLAAAEGEWLTDLAKAKEKAKRTACLSNLKQVSVASFLYAGDNRDFLPPMRDPQSGKVPGSWAWDMPTNTIALMLGILATGGKDDLSEMAEELQSMLGNAYARPLVKALAARDWAEARRQAQEADHADGTIVPQVVLQLVGLEERLPYAAPLRVPGR